MMATQTHVSSAPPAEPQHGVKRSLEDDQRAQPLTKRFHLLNLDNQQNGKLWTSKPEAPVPATERPMVDTSDSMNVDDTRNRIYINDLDAELATVSDTEEEQKVIFLPDIDRKLSKLPHAVLAGNQKQEDDEDDFTGQELILYNVPHSLSVPEEQDSVRKAIIESRARSREQQQKGDVQPRKEVFQRPRIHSPRQACAFQQAGNAEDPDAMDLG